MDPPIEPQDWDVIVVGSGLPQCLVASAVVKAGRSVLLIDQEDTYGSEYASFTLEALHQAALGARDVSLTAEPMHGHTHGQQQPHAPPGSPSPPFLPEGLQPGTVSVALPAFSLPLHGVSGFCAPGEAGPAASSGYILDLMPKMLYQSEPLVDLLVKCRAHHYLEFKRVEGSYTLTPASAPSPASTASTQQAQPGPSRCAAPGTSSSAAGHCTLRPVPASKSDIFKDRTLSLSEKRSLMGFLSAAVEAVQGTGRLKDVMSGDAPLIDVLRSEGVPEPLRHVILHGIAMCDSAQEADRPSASGAAGSGTETCGSGGGGAAAAPGLGPGSSAGQGYVAPVATTTAGAEVLTAREGAAALQLLMESTARFGGPGAFMVPSWGCGALPEAFVRCCAVAGGTTVLRCPVVAALLRRHSPVSGGEPAINGVTEGLAGGGSSAAGEPVPIVGAAEAAADADADADADVLAVPGPRGSAGPVVASDSAAAACQAQAGLPSAGGHKTPGAADGWTVTGVVTGRGQVLTCRHLVAGAAAMWAVSQELASRTGGATTTTSALATSGSNSHGAPPSSSHQRPHVPPFPPPPPVASVSRALVIMDSPLVPGQSNLTIFIPPRSPVLGGVNRHPVRALQAGPTLAVCPRSRYLLYLSTPDEGDEARQALQLAVGALVQTADLVPLAQQQQQQQQQSPGVGEPAHEQPAAALGPGDGQAGSSTPQTQAKTTSEAPDSRPRALQVFYYTQSLPQGPGPSPGRASCSLPLPTNATCASVPGGLSPLGLVGHTRATEAAETAFRSAFPGLQWLSELDPGMGEGGGAGDDDDDAIDDLQAALGNLGGGQGEEPDGQGNADS